MTYRLPHPQPTTAHLNPTLLDRDAAELTQRLALLNPTNTCFPSAPIPAAYHANMRARGRKFTQNTAGLMDPYSGLALGSQPGWAGISARRQHAAGQGHEACRQLIAHAQKARLVHDQEMKTLHESFDNWAAIVRNQGLEPPFCGDTLLTFAELQTKLTESEKTVAELRAAAKKAEADQKAKNEKAAADQKAKDEKAAAELKATKTEVANLQRQMLAMATKSAHELEVAQAVADELRAELGAKAHDLRSAHRRLRTCQSDLVAQMTKAEEYAHLLGVAEGRGETPRGTPVDGAWPRSRRNSRSRRWADS